MSGMNAMQEKLPAECAAQQDIERLFNLSLDLLCVSGFNGFFKRVNPSFQRVLGYTPKELGAIPFIELVHPDDRAATLSTVKDVASTGAACVNFENRFRCKDGTFKWLSWTAHPDLEHQVVYAVARDVTLRKNMEDRLRASNEELMAVNEDLRIMDEELMRQLADLKTKEDANKTLEESLRQSLSMANAIFESTEDGLLVVDLDGRITGHNQRFLEIWSLPQSSPASTYDELLSHILSQLDNSETFLQKVRELYADPGMISNDVLKLKDGRVLERYSQPHRLEGQCIGRVYSFRDVTRRHQLEEGLRVSNEELVAANEELVASNEELRAIEEELREQYEVSMQRKAALRESERRFRCLLETVQLAAIMLDTEGRIIFCNDYLLRLTERRRDEVLGQDWFDLFVPEDLREDNRQYVLESLRQKKNLAYTARQVITSTGERRLINWSPTLLYDPAGNVLGFAAIGEDVTERKKWEEQLNLQAKLLSSVLDPVVVVDQDEQIIYWNKGAEQLYGWGSHEVLGRPLSEVNRYDWVNPGDAETSRKSLIETGSWFGMNLHHKRDGEKLYVESTVKMLKTADGAPTGMMAVIRDVTERKRITEELSLQKAYFEQLFENSPQGILLLDNANCIIHANKGFEELFLYRTKESRGMNVDHLIVPEHLAEEGMQIARSVQEGQITHKETVRMRKDGSLVNVSILAYPITLNDGMVGMYAIYRDISARIKAEENLRAANQKLLDIIDFLPDATFVVDTGGKVIAWNRAMEEMTGVPKDQMIGKNDYAYSVPFYGVRKPMMIDLIVGKAPVPGYELVEEKDHSLSLEVFAPQVHRGRGAFLAVKASPLFDRDGKLVGAIESVRDITERNEMEQQLKYLGLHDSLTGLYNRTYFEQQMRRLDLPGSSPTGIIICDVDGLKLVNDTFGHSAGDTLLVTTANILKQTFRENDIVARIGGDEFAVLLRKTSKDISDNACIRILNAVADYNSKHPELPLSMSIGLSVSNDGTRTIEELFREADNNMYREKLHRSQSARSAIVQTLMKALEARDFITEGHADRLQSLVTELAKAIGLSLRRINDLRLLAQFHDIGKVGIPDRILSKPNSLSPEETAEMRRHCEIGYRIAQSAPDLAPLADWILKHHEWWNGGGYPQGLKGDEIPLECRILAVADAFDAMTSDRPYRKAMSHQSAMQELRRCAGTQFDPWLVEKFVAALSERPPSSGD